MLKENIASIVDSFTSIHPNKKIYELYINKLDPDNSILILYAGDNSLTGKENIHYNQSSNIQVISNNISIDIYTGMERYISKMDSPKSLDNNQKSNSSDGLYWVINDSCGILRTKKDYSTIYPFMPLPIEINKNALTPPIIED
jgi:hypothetical protein